MSSILLSGKVSGGCGKFAKEITLPNDLINQQNWISSFVQGTMNIKINTCESAIQLPRQMRSLDKNSAFPPCTYRNGSDVINNTLIPTKDEPYQGDVQLWRAILTCLS